MAKILPISIEINYKVRDFQTYRNRCKYLPDYRSGIDPYNLMITSGKTGNML